MKQELEGKISQAEGLNSSLQLELDKVRTEQDSMERDLRAQIDAASQGTGDAELQARYADLETKHQGLQAELPVPEDTRMWLSSPDTAVQNLVHAFIVESERLGVVGHEVLATRRRLR